MWTCVLLPLLLLLAVVRPCVGFQCHVCSYSVNTDKNRDCIDALDTLTAPGNFFTCNRTCTIQENYSLEEKKVTSYMRTCSVVTKSGYCVRDTWNLVCYFSCTGNLCNNYPGELHSVLPEQDFSSDNKDHGDGSWNSEDHASSCTGHSALLVCCLLTFGLAFVF